MLIPVSLSESGDKSLPAFWLLLGLEDAGAGPSAQDGHLGVPDVYGCTPAAPTKVISVLLAALH